MILLKMMQNVLCLFFTNSKISHGMHYPKRLAHSSGAYINFTNLKATFSLISILESNAGILQRKTRTSAQINGCWKKYHHPF